MDRKEINERVLTIIQDITNDKSIDENSHLIFEGILSSLQIIELISELEKDFAIKIPLTEIVPDNFDQVGSLCDMIERINKA